jgi:hypothetical protein
MPLAHPAPAATSSRAGRSATGPAAVQSAAVQSAAATEPAAHRWEPGLATGLAAVLLAAATEPAAGRLAAVTASAAGHSRTAWALPSTRVQWATAASPQPGEPLPTAMPRDLPVPRPQARSQCRRPRSPQRRAVRPSRPAYGSPSCLASSPGRAGRADQMTYLRRGPLVARQPSFLTTRPVVSAFA